MKFSVAHGDFKEIEASSLIKFCTIESLRTDSFIKELNKISLGMIKELYDTGEFSGKAEEEVVLYRYPGIKAGKLVLVGLGNYKSVNAESYRKAAGRMTQLNAVSNSEDLAVCFDIKEDIETAQAIVEGFQLGRFKILDYKTVDKEDNSKTASMTFYVNDRRRLNKLQKAVDRGDIISDSVMLARRLTEHPGNVLTPRKFAAEIKALGKSAGFETEILDEKQIRAEKMGAFLAVAQGSDQPPRFAIMKYNGGRPKSKPVVLVGKGITFDAGGISLKPALNMGEMKGDMQGAAVVIGATVAAARLKLPINLVCLVPMTENMPSGKAIKPGDIITSRKGKTVEIINTDAEGRLILADALDYANNFDPQAVFDVATLTGAAKYVLGSSGVPIISNNQKVIDAIFAASKRCGEKVWQLPMWPEFHEKMKSSIADLQNSGGPESGTMTAGAFLEEFIGNWPWTHIDIAAVDVEKTGKPYIPKGVTGIGLRLLIDTLMHWKKV